MPSFVKNPKFIGGAIIVLWLAYVIYANFQLAPIQIKLLPFVAYLQFRVSAVIMAAAIFGALVTLAIQLLWKRRSSKNASTSAAA
jgi:uncharacterized integral membrane protein